jgi:hypothetical protein
MSLNYQQKEQNTMPKGIKKKSPVKKISKKSVTKKVSKVKPLHKESMALATISYQDIVHSEVFESKRGGKAMHLLASHFSQSVLDFINSPTPPKYILKREGTGRKMFDYIPGWYARKCANYAFGFNHSFEIKSKEIVGLTAVVEGRFIITDPKTGKEILHKDDIGGHEIRFLKDGKKGDPLNAVNIANDYKSAVTDCMKRCMAQIGFWKDVYGTNEAREDGNYINGAPVTQPIQQIPPVTAKAKTIDVPVIEAECHECANPITKQEAEFSKKIYKKQLCRTCQKARKK